MTKKQWALLFLALLSAGCSQRLYIEIEPASEPSSAALGAKVTGELYTMPIFTRYLQDLDLFAGAERPESSPPSLVSDTLDFFKNNAGGYKQSDAFNASSGSFKIDFSFNFDDYQALFKNNAGFIWGDLFSIQRENNLTTLVFRFSSASHKRLEQTYPVVMPVEPIAGAADGGTKHYQESYAKLIASSLAERQSASVEIDNSFFAFSIKAPSPIQSVFGGIIDKKDPYTAHFKIPLMRILFLQKEIEMRLSY